MDTCGLWTKRADEKDVRQDSLRQAGDEGLEAVAGVVDLLARDHERRQEAQDRVADVVHDQALGQALLHHLRGDRHVELGAAHEAVAAHLAHVRQGRETVAQVAPDGEHMLAHVGVEKRVHAGQTHRAGERAATEGGAVVTGDEKVGHLGAGGDRTHREAVGDALGHGHHVGKGEPQR